jgi:hypothetical protein
MCGAEPAFPSFCHLLWIAVKRSRNSLSLALTPGIDIHCPVPTANLYQQCTAELIHRSLHPPARSEDFVSGRNSASWLDRVLGPWRPVLRRAIAGIASDRISVTGTGVGRIGRRALKSIARRTGVSGVSPGALISIAGLRVARISITRRPGVGGVSRGARISIARLRVARISVGGISVSKRSVGLVAVISARWRRRCTRDSSEYPGCPSDRCSEGGSRPTTRRCSNGSTGGCSQYAPTKAALNRIIRVGAGRETQGRRGSHIERNSGHYPTSLRRRLVEPTTTTDHRTLSLD